MKLTIALITTTLAAAGIAAPAAAEPAYGMNVNSSEAVAKSRPGSFDVYIDPPTGYAFVNTSAGWIFTRQVAVGAAIAPQEDLSRSLVP
ncbi:MAG TPA: hypothetical protein VLC55_11455 [Burkholderiales bacterium]|nr:hypothetical protein [Burkholderiales bacterium]